MNYLKMSAEQRAAYDKARAAFRATQREFVLESERISGEGYDPNVAQTEAFLKAYWEGMKAHLEIAQILTEPGGNYVSVWSVNAALTRNSNGFVRTGIPGIARGLVPEAKDIPLFLRAFDDKIKSDIATYASASEVEKDDRAWAAHDEVACSDFFRGYNTRTARLVYAHVRTLFGLPIHVIRFEKSPEYYAKLQHYKATIFVPELPARTEMLRAQAAREAAEAAEIARRAKLAREAAINAVISSLGIGTIDVRFARRESGYAGVQRWGMTRPRRSFLGGEITPTIVENVYPDSVLAG